MFDIAWSEFLIVAVVALVVVGPRDLPALLRQVGRMVATVRKMAGEFQTQFNDALKEAELDDLRREVTGLKDIATKATSSNPFSIAGDELKKAMEGKPSEAKPSDAPSALAGETPEPAQIGSGPIPSALAPEAPAEPTNGAPAVQHSEPSPAPAAPVPAQPLAAPSDAPPPPSDTESVASEPKSGAAS